MKNAKERHKKEIDWLSSAVVPINSVELYSDYGDLSYLKARAKNAKIVALGEVTHGSSEISKMKTKIARYLIEKCGFNIFAIEAAMPEAYNLNEYILKGKGDPKELIAGMGFWTWDTQEVLDFVNWMKDYNDHHKKKVIFAGFDMQFYRGAVSEIKKLYNIYHIKDEPGSLDDLETNLEKFKEMRKYKPAPFTQKELRYFKEEFSFLRKFGNKNIRNTKEKAWFLRCIRILEQSATLTQDVDRFRSFNRRDRWMAENLLWITNHNKHPRVIVWAHNAHIRKADKTPMYKKMMGYYVSKRLKQKYLAVGFAINRGKYTARHWKTEKLSVYPLQTAYPGTYEYYFHMVGKPLFLLDFKRLNFGDPAGKWLKKKLRFRMTGAAFYYREFSPEPIFKDFDMVVFIERSTPTKLLHKH